MKILVLGAGAVAVSADGRRWVLLNATAQAVQHTLLQTALDAGHIAAVVLMDALIEHAAGVPALGDGRPLDLFATPSVFEQLTTAAPLLGLRGDSCGVRWHLVPVAGDLRCVEFRVEGIDALRFHAIAVEARHDGVVGDSIALCVEDRVDGRRLFCSPVPPGDDALPWMQGADCLLVAGALQHAQAGLEIAP